MGSEICAAILIGVLSSAFAIAAYVVARRLHCRIEAHWPGFNDAMKAVRKRRG